MSVALRPTSTAADIDVHQCQPIILLPISPAFNNSVAYFLPIDIVILFSDTYVKWKLILCLKMAITMKGGTPRQSIATPRSPK